MLSAIASVLSAIASEEAYLFEQAVIGNGLMVGPNKRISLCRQSATDAADSEDEQLGGKAADTSGFSSAEGSEADSEEQPSPSCVLGAAAAAAGNSLPGKRKREPFTPDATPVKAVS